MIAYYAKRSKGEAFEKVERPIKSDVWVDAADVNDVEIDQLVDQYNLDPNIVYDVRDVNELPRVEYSKNEVYVFVRLPQRKNGRKLHVSPLLCIASKNWFITTSRAKTVAPESVALSTIPVSTNDSATLLLGVIAGTVAAYETDLQHTISLVADTAKRLSSHEVTNQDFIHFVAVEDDLNTYKMNLRNLRVVASRLRDNSHEIFDAGSLEALDDIALHIDQLLAGVESSATNVESIRNAYTTIANNKLNQRMKTLTVFTVLITLPNVIYGMFGMNVAFPLSTAPWAYAVIVGFTICLTVGVYAVAKRMKIL